MTVSRKHVPLSRVPRSNVDSLWDTSGVLIGYARVSTAAQDLTRQLAELEAAGVDPDRIYVDKKTGANTDRPGMTALRDYARKGDTIVVVTLDRLARNLRDTLNLIHDLTVDGIGLRSLKDPIPVDTTSDEAMAKISVLMLSLMAEMERVWNRERVEHARQRAGRSPGRKRTLTTERVDFARRAIAAGDSIRQTATAMGVPKSTLARALREQTPA